MRYVRDNPAREANAVPPLTECIAHRCAEHAQLRPCDDSADDGSECGFCLADKLVASFEESLEDDLKRRLFWPAIDTARDRLNLLAHGAGDAFVDEIRRRVTEYDAVKHQPAESPDAALPAAEAQEHTDGPPTRTSR